MQPDIVVNVSPDRQPPPSVSEACENGLVEQLVAQPPIECNAFAAARTILMNSDRLMLLSQEQAWLEITQGLPLARKPPGERMARSKALYYRGCRPTRLQLIALEQVRAISGRLESDVYDKKAAFV